MDSRCSHHCVYRQAGFTLLEIAFVLLVVGIVASMLVPSVAGVHHKQMIEEDRKILRDLKDVLIGQFLATGRLPACVTSASATPPGSCDTASSIGGLGIRTTDSRNNSIRYDVWNVDDLADPTNTDLTSTDLATICGALNAAINLPATAPAGPSICSSAPDYDVQATWGTYCPATNPVVNRVAFVLVGTGGNRPGQSNETPLSSGFAPGNRNIGADRVFENPGRRHNQRFYYDDLMEVVTFQQLRTAINNVCP